MRNWMIVAVMLLCVNIVSGQANQEPAYKRFPTVPPFNLITVDSAALTKDQLKKNKPVMIMYFSPQCDHCQHQMEDMIRRMDDLKDIQIVMATYSPMNELEDFIKKYKLSKYRNISLGRDARYMIQPFYKISGLPYQALYDAKGDLITTFEGNVKIDKLLSAYNRKD